MPYDNLRKFMKNPQPESYAPKGMDDLMLRTLGDPTEGLNPLRISGNLLEEFDSVTGKPLRAGMQAAVEGNNPLSAIKEYFGAGPDKDVSGREVVHSILSRTEGAGMPLRPPGANDYAVEAPLGHAIDFLSQLPGIEAIKGATKLGKAAIEAAPSILGNEIGAIGRPAIKKLPKITQEISPDSSSNLPMQIVDDVKKAKTILREKLTGKVSPDNLDHILNEIYIPQVEASSIVKSGSSPWKLRINPPDNITIPEMQALSKENIRAYTDSDAKIFNIPVKELEKYKEYDRLGGDAYKTPEELNRLIESIKKEGIKEPLTLSFNEEGKAPLLTEGNHRLAIAKKLGLETVPVKYLGLGGATLLGAGVASSEAQASEYGNRPDGTPKGKGFLGKLRRPDGDVMTELSVGVNIGGKQMDIPTLVPTLTQEEISTLLNLGPGEQIPRSIIQKAVDHAKIRLRQGQSVFAQDGEQKYQNLKKLMGK